jgi:hypothetical protein
VESESFAAGGVCALVEAEQGEVEGPERGSERDASGDGAEAVVVVAEAGSACMKKQSLPRKHPSGVL